MKKTNQKGKKTLAELDAEAAPASVSEAKVAEVNPVTPNELRLMLQPVAEKMLWSILNEVLTGRFQCPVYITGHRGLGKTTWGLEYPAELLTARGWTREAFPFKGQCSQGQVLGWLAGLVRTENCYVITADESENFPWEHLKELLDTNKRHRTFTVKGEEGIETLTYKPEKFLWLLASNFSVDNGERGAGESRCQKVAFLPLNETDKATLVRLQMDAQGLTHTPESVDMLVRNVLPIGRDIEKQIAIMAGFARQLKVLDTKKAADVRELILLAAYTRKGLNAQHVSALRYLLTAPRKRNGETYGRTLQDVRVNALDGSDEAEVMSSLTACGFVATGNSGRKGITPNGEEYLTDLDAWELKFQEDIVRARLPIPAWQVAWESLTLPAATAPSKKPTSKKGKK